jgi:4-hydroxy-tetrahydrodipicolinate synthase
VSRGALAGIVPVILLPFDEDGGVDTASLERELDFLIELGVTWLAFGFGSEVFRLTESELDDVVAFTVRHCRDRAGVIVSVRAGSAPAAARRAEAAAVAGAKGVMLPMPPFATVPQHELVDLYRGVADASGLGIVVQDAPAMSGAEFSLPTLAAIVEEVPGVLALKIETSASAEKMSRLLEQLPDGVSVLGGNGGLDLYRELERGAAGTMPSAALADVFIEICRRYADGEHEQARDLHATLLPLLILGQRDLDTFLYVEKEALRRRGIIDSSRLRTPSARPSAALQREVEAELRRLTVFA